MLFSKKTSPRRSRVRKDITAERFLQMSRLIDRDNVTSILLWLIFVVFSVIILSFDLMQHHHLVELIPIVIVITLSSLAAAFYIVHYQPRIIKNHVRATALLGMLLFLLVITKLGMFLKQENFWATGTVVTAAIVLTIAYDQRFAIGISLFYSVLAFMASADMTNTKLLLIMASGALTCCFCLREIRTRMKLLEVSTIAGIMVFITAIASGMLERDARLGEVFSDAGSHTIATFAAGLLIQGLLPLIERAFKIATSMTLLDYSDANQPLLKRLAMEAPGTYSHSLIIGSIAEVAAESVGCNGLLCRVGAYYHDIGKINKPTYFVENELGSSGRHKELSPAMSQLIIVGHVKDGMEMARQYSLPAVLRQFIETHHGTTLVEYFYDQAKKRHGQKHSRQAPAPSESEFRYPGPRPETKEAAIVMLADVVEGAVRSLPEVTSAKIEAVVHNMAMKRLQDGQFDECELSLRELSQIETSLSKALTGHYHGRIAYPSDPSQPPDKNNAEQSKTQ